MKRAYKLRKDAKSPQETSERESLSALMKQKSQIASPFQHSSLKTGTGSTNIHESSNRNSLQAEETISFLEDDNQNCSALYKDSKTSAIESILGYIKSIVVRNEDGDEEEEVIDEWKQVALVVDRLLFWIFLFITLFSTIVILVIVPSTSYSLSGGI